VGASDIGAPDKRKGFSPGASARHRSRTRVSTGIFLLFFTFPALVVCFLGCFFLFCEIERLLD